LRASWGDAPEIAEVLASHYLAAVDAEPDAVDAGDIRASACATLSDAGRRALSLALGTEARHYFEHAATLASSGLERARLLAEAGSAATRTADTDGAKRLLGEAIEVLDVGGNLVDAARTRARLADVLIMDNQLEAAVEVIGQARGSITDEVVLGELASGRARAAFLAGDYALARDEAELALSIADRHQMHAVISSAAMTKAIALYYDNRLTEGGAMMSLGLQVALDADLSDQALRGYYNLADFRLAAGSPADAASLLDQGLELARERGHRDWEVRLLAQSVGVELVRGNWDVALELIEAVGSGVYNDNSSPEAENRVPLIAAARGDVAALEQWLAHPPAALEWHEVELVGICGRAIALAGTGRLDEAASLLEPVLLEIARSATVSIAPFLGDVVDITLEAGRPELLEELFAELTKHRVLLIGAQRLRGEGLLMAYRNELPEAERLLSEAVAAFRAVGARYALARGLFDHGSVLIDVARPGDATAALQEARSLFEQLRATPWLERTDRALAPLVPA
jgi:tetratricopeptide (TPR) repeat protein